MKIAYLFGIGSYLKRRSSRIQIFSFINPLEFVFERLLLKKGRRLDQITGKTEKDKKKFCKNFYYFREAMSLGSFYGNGTLYFKAREEILTSLDTLLKVPGFKEYFPREDVRQSSMGLVNAIQRRCIPYYQYRTESKGVKADRLKADMAKAFGIVKERFVAFAHHGLKEELETEFKNFFDSLKRLRNNFAMTPACHSIIQLKDPNFMHEALEKRDLSKLQDLMDKAPLMALDSQEWGGTPVRRAADELDFELLSIFLNHENFDKLQEEFLSEGALE